jgi:hypothetical protein
VIRRASSFSVGSLAVAWTTIREAMNQLRPLTTLQILAILTVAAWAITAWLGYSGMLWSAATESILICILGASILKKINRGD